MWRISEIAVDERPSPGPSLGGRGDWEDAAVGKPGRREKTVGGAAAHDPLSIAQTLICRAGWFSLGALTFVATVAEVAA